MAAAIEIIEQINALKRDGEKPANHTKNIRAEILIANITFRRFNLLPIKTAIAENIERCIPESARMCERPAVLKLSERLASVNSFDPDKSAVRSPPALPQVYISRLNFNLETARKNAAFPDIFVLFQL